MLEVCEGRTTLRGQESAPRRRAFQPLLPWKVLDSVEQLPRAFAGGVRVSRGDDHERGPRSAEEGAGRERRCGGHRRVRVRAASGYRRAWYSGDGSASSGCSTM